MIYFFGYIQGWQTIKKSKEKINTINDNVESRVGDSHTWIFKPTGNALVPKMGILLAILL